MRFNIFFLLVLLTNPINQSRWKTIVKLSQDREQSKRFLEAGISGDHSYPLQLEVWQVFCIIILWDVLPALVLLQAVLI